MSDFLESRRLLKSSRGEYSEGNKLWIEWRRKWHAGIVANRDDCFKSAMKSSTTPMEIDEWVLVFLPRFCSFIWTNLRNTRPFEEIPNRGEIDCSLKCARTSVADSTLPKKYSLLMIGEKILDISDRLPLQAVVEGARTPTFWAGFAMRTVRAKEYRDLGALLLDTFAVIKQKLLRKAWLKIHSSKWKDKCLSVRSAHGVESLNQTLLSNVIWEKVTVLWDSAVVDMSDWSTWKDPWKQAMQRVMARAQPGDTVTVETELNDADAVAGEEVPQQTGSSLKTAKETRLGRVEIMEMEGHEVEESPTGGYRKWKENFSSKQGKGAGTAGASGMAGGVSFFAAGGAEGLSDSDSLRQEGRSSQAPGSTLGLPSSPTPPVVPPPPAIPASTRLRTRSSAPVKLSKKQTRKRKKQSKGRDFDALHLLPSLAANDVRNKLRDEKGTDTEYLLNRASSQLSQLFSSTLGKRAGLTKTRAERGGGDHCLLLSNALREAESMLLSGGHEGREQGEILLELVKAERSRIETELLASGTTRKPVVLNDASSAEGEFACGVCKDHFADETALSQHREEMDHFVEKQRGPAEHTSTSGEEGSDAEMAGQSTSQLVVHRRGRGRGTGRKRLMRVRGGRGRGRARARGMGRALSAGEREIRSGGEVMVQSEQLSAAGVAERDTEKRSRQNLVLCRGRRNRAVELSSGERSLLEGKKEEGLMFREREGLLQAGIVIPDLSGGLEPIPVPCVVDMAATLPCSCTACQQSGQPWQPPSIADLPSFQYVTQRRLDPLLGLNPCDFQVACSCKGHHCSPSRCDHVRQFAEDNEGAVDSDGLPLLNRFAYDDRGRIVLKENYLVYECSAACGCLRSCPNRVLQRGLRVPLEVFRTHHKGWAVRSTRDIACGSFICEYIGEVISDEEAHRRGKIYDMAGVSYLYDIDAHIDAHTDEDAASPFVIDATHIGNVARFINHSCAPNLVNYQVLVESMDYRLAHIGLFATRDIPAGEELCYDYKYQQIEEARSCHCGAPLCRRRLH